MSYNIRFIGVIGALCGLALTGLPGAAFGHGFGLADLAGHPALTMNNTWAFCSNDNATLGKGDIVGLGIKY